jgi:outer membrane lipoprotein-sorting protein
MTDRDGLAKDVLDRALEALRAAPIQEGPSPELAASTVEALQSMTGPATVRLDQKRTTMTLLILRNGVFAAAAVFLVYVASWLFLMDCAAAPAFADVIQKLQDAKSVAYVTEMPTIIEGTKHGVLRQQFYIQGDALRMELPSVQEGATVPAGAPPLLMAIIWDAKQRKVLQLDFVGKTAKTIIADEKMWNEMAGSIFDPIKQLCRLKDEDAQRLDDEVLDGAKTQVYRLRKTDLFMGMKLGKDETAKLWVDATSGLPVRLAIGDPTDKGSQFLVFKDFRWNAAFDPELFRLDVPKGFTLKDK